MTFKEQLRAHIGGLVRLNTQLYWYQSAAWDGVEERVCILLDSATADIGTYDSATEAVGPRMDRSAQVVKVLLLIDGSSKWIWIAEKNVEFVQ